MNIWEIAGRPGSMRGPIQVALGFVRFHEMDEERFVRIYEEIMQCTERDARSVYMYVSLDIEDSDAVAPASRTSF